MSEPWAIGLLEALPEAGVLLTRSGVILRANALARAALGLPHVERHAVPLAELVEAEELARCLRTWAHSAEPTTGTLVVRGADGSEPRAYAARGSIVSPATADEEALLFVRFWPRESEQQLRERAAELEKLARAKDEFLAMISHELRTPLTAILGWASILQRSKVEGRVAHGVEIIRRNAVTQTKLIEDLLDVSRITTGKLRMQTDTIELGDIAEYAVEQVMPAAVAAGVDVRLRIGVRCHVTGDAERLKQVVANLLNNSVKFSASGTAISVTVDREGDDVVLRVVDQGRGIDAAFLPYVFEPFRQGDRFNSRRTSGLGIGLALVRHIVEGHGGSVSASSDGDGRGSTFSVKLPCIPTPPPADTATDLVALPAGAPERPLAGLRVLVVEDHTDTRDIIGLVLAEAGAQVRGASSAASAELFLGAFDADVVLTDIAMPGEDGFSLLARLRARPGVPHLPIVACTAHAYAADRQAALDAGFDAHLRKPVHPDELVDVILLMARTTRATRSAGC